MACLAWPREARGMLELRRVPDGKLHHTLSKFPSTPHSASTAEAIGQRILPSLCKCGPSRQGNTMSWMELMGRATWENTGRRASLWQLLAVSCSLLQAAGWEVTQPREPRLPRVFLMTWNMPHLSTISDIERWAKRGGEGCRAQHSSYPICCKSSMVAVT